MIAPKSSRPSGCAVACHHLLRVGFKRVMYRETCQLAAGSCHHLLRFFSNSASNLSAQLSGGYCGYSGSSKARRTCQPAGPRFEWWASRRSPINTFPRDSSPISVSLSHPGRSLPPPCALPPARMRIPSSSCSMQGARYGTGSVSSRPIESG